MKRGTSIDGLDTPVPVLELYEECKGVVLRNKFAQNPEEL
jgi:hypothetical protein